MSSTAAATLRQLVMFVVDKVVEEDRRLLLANELESITLPDGTTKTLGPVARGTFAIFEDSQRAKSSERPSTIPRPQAARSPTHGLLDIASLTPRTIKPYDQPLLCV